MTRINGIFKPDFSMEDIPNQPYQHLAFTLGELDRQYARYQHGKIDHAKLTSCETSNAYIAPICKEMRSRELSEVRI